MGSVESEIQPIPRVSIQPVHTTQPQWSVVGSSVVAPVYTQCAIPTVTTQFKSPATCQNYTAPQSIAVAPALPGSSTAQAAQPSIASQMPTTVVSAIQPAIVQSVNTTGSTVSSTSTSVVTTATTSATQALPVTQVVATTTTNATVPVSYTHLTLPTNREV